MVPSSVTTSVVVLSNNYASVVIIMQVVDRLAFHTHTNAFLYILNAKKNKHL